MVRTMMKSVAIGLLLCGTTAWGAPPKKLPPMPDTWINGNPRQMDDLAGKVLVIFFFHEAGDLFPTLLPQFIEMEKKYADQPIAFFAVNADNPPAKVAQAVRDLRIPFPTMADVNGKYQYDWGFRGVNKQYPLHYGVVRADGSAEYATTEQVEQYVKEFLPAAKWRIDPATVTERLQKAWRAAEFGDMTGAISQLKRLTKLKDEKEQQVADAIQAIVDDSLKRQMGEAGQLKSTGKTWQAYKAYNRIADAFKGLPGADEARAESRKLGDDEQVRIELKARSFLEKMRPLVHSDNPGIKQRAVESLRDMANKWPDAEATREALNLIN